MNIAIYLYKEAEVLDFAGPFEVFSTASRISGVEAPFTPFLVSEKKGPLSARGGFRVTAAYALDNHPEVDVLIVPGGVHEPEMEKPMVVDWIRNTARRARITASVCTGAFLLAEAGLLDSRQVTTHWEDIPSLRSRFPGLTVLEFKRWVDEGDVVTAAGISAGIDMSLHLVERLQSRDLAERTARQMEFDWTHAE